MFPSTWKHLKKGRIGSLSVSISWKREKECKRGEGKIWEGTKPRICRCCHTKTQHIGRFWLANMLVCPEIHLSISWTNFQNHNVGVDFSGHNFGGQFSGPKCWGQNFITNFLGTIFWAKKISTNMQRFKNTPLTRTIRKLLAITDGFRDLSSSLNWPTLRHRWLKSNDDIVKQSWGATTCLRRKTTDGLASPLLLLPPKDETTSKIHIIPTYCHIMMIIILWYDMISWYHDISPTYNHFTLLSSQHVSFAHSFVSPCYLPIAFELF